MHKAYKTPEAEQDFISIWVYVSHDSVRAADVVLDELDRECSRLAVRPGMGPGRPELGRDVQSWPVRPYVVFYRRVTGGIEVLRVLHGAQDIQSAFTG